MASQLFRSNEVRPRYDVFLSFRGEDTRRSFTSHLFHSLKDSGVNVFIDEDQLSIGEGISTAVIQAIRESRISVVVFSRNYTSSRWCLRELAEILECRKTLGQTVLPVFYDVHPSDVRKQTGSFGEALQKHKEETAIHRWGEALTEVGKLKGWDLTNPANGVEAEIVRDIVRRIWNELKHTSLDVAKYPVGLDYQVDLMIKQLHVGLDDGVRFVGICGMGGIGKTALAKAVYNKLLDTFEATSFLASVRERSEQPNGLLRLQEQLLCDLLQLDRGLELNSVGKGVAVIKERLCSRRILLVVDDASDFNQLKALVGELSWFGPGSRIIITTRDQDLLKKINKVDYIYMVKELNDDESFFLFNLHAFGSGKSKEGFVDLSMKLASYCGGIPLVLEAMGSFLLDRSIEEWRRTLEKLSTIPHRDVQKQLQLSFDTLDDNEKEIFLHIACFFHGYDKDYVSTVLNGCGLYGEVGISDLTKRCLLNVELEQNKLCMHDLIRDMGKEIVRRESPKNPGSRSRLWSYHDIMRTLKTHSGTGNVQGLALNPAEFNEISAQALAGMTRLKLLQLSNVHIHGKYGLLSKELIWICWHKFSLNFIPEDFDMGNMVCIDMQYSKLQVAWKDSQPQFLGKLKFLNLSHSHSLKRTPDFFRLPHLEELILEDCIQLKEVDPSIICLHRSLVVLSLKDCKSLKSLPECICSIISLQVLDISGCSKIKKLPDNLGQMEALVKLLAQGTAVREVPPSIARLKNLKEFSLTGLETSSRIPSSKSFPIASLWSSTSSSIDSLWSSASSSIDSLRSSTSSSMITSAWSRLSAGRQPERTKQMDKISVADAMPGNVLLILGRYHRSSEDTGDAFVSHLLSVLMASGISVDYTTAFMNEKDVMQMIESSNFCIPIFSEDENSLPSSIEYMVESGKLSHEKVILPIFYDIKPSQILQRIDDWYASTTLSFSLIKALRDILNTSGWVVRKPSSGVIVSLIAQEVSSILGYKHLDMADHIVGIDRKVEFMMDLLDIELSDRRIVGICGMGGIGKTVLAKAVYRRISTSFEGCCFLEDIGETIKRRRDALQFLQTKMISDILKRECGKIDSIDEGISFLEEMLYEMRVLVVLDDVQSGFNLKELVGKLDSFGPGSRIIITTRNKENLPKGVAIYDIPKMSHWEVYHQFNKYVDRDNISPDAHYRKLKQDIASTIGGIPLVVEVIASFLSHKSISVWKDTAAKLRRLTEEKIYKKLMISVGSLKLQQKHIFMDIACFADRKDIRVTSYLWHYPTQAEGLKRLLDMSLVKIGENKELLMHSELRKIGRQLLCQEIKRNEGTEVEHMYRPWVQEENFETVLSKKGIENAEALRLCFDDRSEYQDIELRMMPNIRYLRLDQANIVGDFNDIFLNLMWLHWEGCPGDFRATNLLLKSLVILNLSRSGITENWGGWSQLKMAIELKVLDLTGCAELTITPDLSGFPNLERLILERCSALVKLDPSICNLKKLRSLNLRFCTELSALPKELGLLKALEELLIDGTSIREIPVSLGHAENIETLSASDCFSLTGLPRSIGYLNSLSDLTLDHAKINELPSSISGLVCLQRLSVRDCRWLSELPVSIEQLSDSLLELDVSGTGISALPDSIGNLQRLRVLKTESCFIEEFPIAILKLANLEEIHASYCRNLKQFIPSEGVPLPSEYMKLESLKILRLDYSGVSNLPSNFCYLVSNLLTLDLLHCDMLKVLPELPPSLTSLRFSSNEMEELPKLYDLAHLGELLLADCDFEELIYQESSIKEPNQSNARKMLGVDFDECLVLSDLLKLKRLELYLSRIRTIRFPSSSWDPSSLRKLVLFCPDLESVSCFPLTLLSLSIRHCWSLETLDVGEMIALSELQLHDSAVSEINCLHKLEALKILRISNCKVENLKRLEEIGSLTSLTISNCDHFIRELPSWSSLKMLTELEIWPCVGLVDLTSSVDEV